ncbi:MAG: winged helix-turn-helix domain-containing protein [Pseudomonadota bacterium]
MGDRESNASFEIGTWKINPAELTISNGSTTHVLETKIMDVLLALVSRAGQVVTREDLIDEVWETEFGGDESLSRAISLLRKALGDTRGNHQHIQTIPRKGYQLIAPVTYRNNSAVEPAPPPESTGSKDTVEVRSPQPVRKGPKIAIPALVLVALALAATAVWVVWDKPTDNDETSTVTVELEFIEDTFVVEPFATLDSSATSERLAATLPGELAGTLARQTLSVSQESDATGNGLRPEFRIGGSIREENENTVASIDVAQEHSGAVVLSLQIQRPVSEAFLLNKQVSVDTANTLYCFVTRRSRLQPFRTQEQVILLMRICEASTGDGSEFGSLLKLSQQLLDLSPDDPEAIASLAISQAFLSQRIGGSQSETLRLQHGAYENADRALASNPDNGAALWAKAVVYDPDVPIYQREQYLYQAYENDPGFQWSRNHLGHLYSGTGRLNEALIYYQKLISDFPMDFRRATWVAEAQARLGHVDFARQEMDELVRAFPHAENHVLLRALIMELYLGDPERARELQDTIFTPSNLRTCLERISDARLEDEILSAAEIDQMCRRGSFVNLARIFIMFDHIDEAYGVLEEFEEVLAYPNLGQLRAVLFEPDMAPIRADARFMPFAARLGLVQYWQQSGHWPDFCETETISYNCETAATAASRELRQAGLEILD